jgi:hypothetical protein
LEGIGAFVDGFKPIGATRSFKSLKRLPRLKLNVFPIATDDALAKKVGVLDNLVNCAGSEAAA